MNDNFTILNRWIRFLNLESNGKLETESIHIDELIGEHSKEIIFFKSLELFYDLIHLDFKIDIYKSYVPSLVISLIPSRKIICTMKSNPWEDLDTGDQPSIYLIPKSFFLLQRQLEEYQRPLSLEAFKQLQNDCVISYRCFRNLEEIRDKEPYRRGIYFYEQQKSIRKIEPVLEKIGNKL